MFGTLRETSFPGLFPQKLGGPPIFQGKALGARFLFDYPLRSISTFFGMRVMRVYKRYVLPITLMFYHIEYRTKGFKGNRRSYTLTDRQTIQPLDHQKTSWAIFSFSAFLDVFVISWHLTFNDWSRREQWSFFPENRNVSRDESWGKHWDSRETKFTVPQGTSH